MAVNMQLNLRLNSNREKTSPKLNPVPAEKNTASFTSTCKHVVLAIHTCTDKITYINVSYTYLLALHTCTIKITYINFSDMYTTSTQHKYLSSCHFYNHYTIWTVILINT